MSVALKCQECGTNWQVSEAELDDGVNCPHCLASVTIHQAESKDDSQDPYRAPVDQSDTKECPYCAETIKAEATICRHCKERVDEESLCKMWREGKNILVMTKEARLPARCIKTNEPTDRTLRRDLSWHNPLLYLLLFVLGPIPFIIVAMIISKKATIHVGLSDKGFSKRRWAIFYGFLGFFGFIGLSIYGFGSITPQSNVGVYVGIGGIILALVAAIIGNMKAATVTPTKITDTHIWLKGAHPDYLAGLPVWVGP